MRMFITKNAFVLWVLLVGLFLALFVGYLCTKNSFAHNIFIFLLSYEVSFIFMKYSALKYPSPK